MRGSLKFLRYAIIGGIFIIPFLALVVSDKMFFPFITGKNFSFRIITEIIFGLWLILIVFDKDYRPRKDFWKNKIVLSLTLFTLFVFLSALFGVNFYRSFWSNYERMEGVLAYLHLFALFLVATSVMGNLKNEIFWKILFNISLGVSIIVGIYGLLQLSGKLEIHQGSTRLDATLGNASYLAIYAAFHFFIALFLFFKTKKWYRWFYPPVALLNIFILYFTATRGTILGVLGAIILAFFLGAFLGESKKIKIYSLSFLLLIIFAVFGFFLLKNSSFVQKSPVLSRFSSISFSETTTQSRLIIWKMSLKGFKERPIFGWGPENYNLVFNKYYDPRLWRQEPWFDRAHNVFLDKLTQNGIFGLLSYLCIFFFSIYYLWFPSKNRKFSKGEAIIFTSLLFAYFFHNIFVFDNIISLILFYFVIAYLTVRVFFWERRGIEENTKNDKKRNIDNLRGAQLAYVFWVFIIGVFLVYYINVPAIKASRDVITALTFSAQRNYEDALKKFHDAIERNSFGSGEAREQLVSFAINVLSAPGVSNELKQKIYDFASSEMKRQIDSSPTDIRYMLFLASLYDRAQNYDAAIELLERAIKISPNKQQLYFELGSAYLSKGDYKNATRVLKTAFELDPEFLEARKIYAAALIFSQEFDAADEIMKDYGGTAFPDERFLLAYMTVKRYDKAISVWERLIEQNPNNFQYYINGAVIYLDMGDREKAVWALEKAIEINPSFKTQGEYYINEIKAGRNP